MSQTTVLVLGKAVLTARRDRIHRGIEDDVKRLALERLVAATEPAAVAANKAALVAKLAKSRPEKRADVERALNSLPCAADMELLHTAAREELAAHNKGARSRQKTHARRIGRQNANWRAAAQPVLGLSPALSLIMAEPSATSGKQEARATGTQGRGEEVQDRSDDFEASQERCDGQVAGPAFAGNIEFALFDQKRAAEILDGAYRHVSQVKQDAAPDNLTEKADPKVSGHPEPEVSIEEIKVAAKSSTGTVDPLENGESSAGLEPDTKPKRTTPPSLEVSGTSSDENASQHTGLPSASVPIPQAPEAKPDKPASEGVAADGHVVADLAIVAGIVTPATSAHDQTSSEVVPQASAASASSPEPRPESQGPTRGAEGTEPATLRKVGHQDEPLVLQHAARFPVNNSERLFKGETDRPAQTSASLADGPTDEGSPRKLLAKIVNRCAAAAKGLLHGLGGGQTDVEDDGHASRAKGPDHPPGSAAEAFSRPSRPEVSPVVRSMADEAADWLFCTNRLRDAFIAMLAELVEEPPEEFGRRAIQRQGRTPRRPEGNGLPLGYLMQEAEAKDLSGLTEVLEEIREAILIAEAPVRRGSPSNIDQRFIVVEPRSPLGIPPTADMNSVLPSGRVQEPTEIE